MKPSNNIHYIHISNFLSTFVRWLKWRLKNDRLPVFFISSGDKRNNFWEKVGWHVVYKAEDKESVSRCLNVSWTTAADLESIKEWSECVLGQIEKTVLWVSPRQTKKSPAMARLLKAAPLLNKKGWRIFGLGMNFEESEFLEPIKLTKLLPIKILEDYGFIFSSHLWALKEWLLRGRARYNIIHSTTFYFFLPDVVTINAITAKWFSIQSKMPLISYKDILEVLVWCPLLIWEKCVFKSPKKKCYLANSTGLGEELQKHIRNEDRVRVLANPVNKNVYNKIERMARRETIRKSLGFNKDDFVAVFISQGQFRRKGLLLAFESIALAREKGLENLKFLVIGGNKEQHRLLARIAKNKYHLDDSSIVLHPKMQDPREGLSASDLFLFPSYFDSSPNVLLEALAMELPAVITPFDGASMYVDHNNGIICDWDSSLLASAIIRIEGKKGVWENMHTGSALDPDSWCNELEKVYRTIKRKKIT